MRCAGRLLLLMPVVALTACQPATPTPQPVPAATDTLPNLPVIVYERIDAGTGTHERWEVYADGRAVREDGVEVYLEPEALMLLMQQIEQAGFFGMEDVYLPSDPGQGGVVYALSVRTDGGMKTVVVADGAPGEPPALVDLIQRIEGLVRREA